MLFARAPRPGRTKTRLGRVLGDERASMLYRAFLDDVVGLAGRCSEIELWAASEDDAIGLRGSYPQLECRTQCEGDLGARMRHALETALASTDRAIVLGTDLPTLPQSHLLAAIEALAIHEIVIGPSADGGFWSIGARLRPPDLSGPRWSTPHALDDTLARIEAQGRRAHLAPAWHDVDEPSDLERLRRELALDPELAPATRALLASFDRA